MVLGGSIIIPIILPLVPVYGGVCQGDDGGGEEELDAEHNNAVVQPTLDKLYVQTVQKFLPKSNLLVHRLSVGSYETGGTWSEL